MGHVILAVLGMVAQMERRFIKERQRDGIEKTRAEGVYRGWTVPNTDDRRRSRAAGTTLAEDRALQLPLESLAKYRSTALRAAVSRALAVFAVVALPPWRCGSSPNRLGGLAVRRREVTKEPGGPCRRQSVCSVTPLPPTSTEMPVLYCS